MKTKVILAFFFLIPTYAVFAQKEEVAISKQVQTFMQCIVAKDSLTFNTLFHDGPVAWTGVFRDSTTAKIRFRDKNFSNVFNDTPKNFFRELMKIDKVEEKFDNIKIVQDGSIAFVSFDYTFWMNGQIYNWGSEYWTMIKKNNEWKITSVIFSMELEMFYPFKKKQIEKG